MRTFLTTLLALFLLGPIWSQTYPLGLKFDDEAYAKVPMKAALMQKDFRSLPSQFSLKKYCPTPGSQGSYGTCVGWASAWAGRTIVEAQAQGWTSTSQITRNAYSHGFLYYNVKSNRDNNCSQGAYINDAMLYMKQSGVVKYEDHTFNCTTGISAENYRRARQHKIKDYSKLFSLSDSKSFKTQAMKKALSEGNPVVIGMISPPSFNRTSGVWNPSESADRSRYGGHAMCVIGYDDTKYGGAFEIMNSWGTNWGNGGFIWITYSDFARFVKYGYEIYAPPVKTVEKPKQTYLKGGLDLVLSTGETMPVLGQSHASGLPYYKVTESYLSGTRFRIHLSNNDPAYVYVIGADQREAVPVFPPEAGISPLLSYSVNHVAIPNEDWYIEMGEGSGSDFLVVLFSKNELDVNRITADIEQGRGSMFEKVSGALSGKLVPPSAMSMESGRIGFTVKGGSSGVAALIVEAERN